jgi:hypothetical protein
MIIHGINGLTVRLIFIANQFNYYFSSPTIPFDRLVFASTVLTCLLLVVSPTPAQEPDANAAKPSWPTHSHDVQHTGVSAVPSEPLRRIRWQTPVDLKPQISSGSLFIHYGSPLVTAKKGPHYCRANTGFGISFLSKCGPGMVYQYRCG